MAGKNSNGNSVGEAQEFTRQMLRTVEQLYRWERILDDLDPDRFALRDVRIKPPAGDGGEWFVVVRAYEEGAPVVAFSSGSSFVECVRLFCTRWVNGDLKWKADQYG